MSSLKRLNCPSCEYTHNLNSSATRQITCKNCGTVYRRETDGSTTDTGFKSAPPPAPSGLEVGASGTIFGERFVVLGRIVWNTGETPAGLSGASAPESRGVGEGWQDWFLTLEGNRALWLIEDEGRLIMERDVESPPELDESQIQAGFKFDLPLDGAAGETAGGENPKIKIVISESYRAHVTAAEGEMPRAVLPGHNAFCADGADERGKNLMTLKFMEDGEVRARLGRPVKKDEIDYVKNIDHGRTIVCPSCAHENYPQGNPAAVLTQVCTNCNTIIDLAGGTPRTAGQVDPALAGVFRLEVGAQGRLKKTDWTVIGRSRYDWGDEEESGYTLEYTLYNPEQGLRFLSEAEGHWNLGEQVEYGPKKSLFSSKNEGEKIKIKKETFKFLEKGDITLTYMDGSLPWKNAPGQAFRYAEAVAPPKHFTELKYEKPDGSKEIEYTMAEYQEHAKLAEAFGIEKVKPRGKGPSQPYKPLIKGEGFLIAGAILLAVASLAGAIVTSTLGKKIFSQTLSKGELLKKEVLTKPFTVEKADTPLEITVRAGLDNAWLYFGVALYDDKKQAVNAGDEGELTYYSGYESGESWSEGDNDKSFYWRVKKAGDYRVLLTVAEGDAGGRTPVTVRVKSGVYRSYFFVYLFFLWVATATILIARKKILS